VAARRSPTRGWFVTFEGPEGAGKTTQAERLLAAFRDAGRAVLSLREPGGTELGEEVRQLLLRIQPGGPPIVPRADALLFNAARAQLVAEQIEPALRAGTTVICSRFADSTLAYQGGGMGLPIDDLQALERFATGGLKPDLTLLLDLPVEIGLGRKRGQEETRFESSYDLAFHGRVRDQFLSLAAEEPARFVTLDARATPDSVFAAVRAAVERRLGPIADDGGRAPRTAARSEPNGPSERITP
jgi:dTMP kinase